MAQESDKVQLVNSPDVNAAAAAFADFCRTVAWLRDPVRGCPWDLKQDHQTLRRYMLEEAYEAAEAMSDDGSTDDLRDELGDVLLQVVLNAQVAYDKGSFSIAEVVQAINSKMIRRHSHVFQPQAENEPSSLVAIRNAWDDIKAAEKQEKAALAGEALGRDSLMAEAQKKHPATLQAYKIGKLAAQVNFDWSHPNEVFSQFVSEVDEVREELTKTVVNKEALVEELGDVYFSLAQLCRHLDVDPELTALEGNRKFLRRFGDLEKLAASQGLEVTEASQEQLEDLWKAVKALEGK